MGRLSLTAKSSPLSEIGSRPVRAALRDDTMTTATKNFFGDHFLGSLETKLRIVTKPFHLVSNPF